MHKKKENIRRNSIAEIVKKPKEWRRNIVC
jgi:hypothetical protein